MLEINKSNRPDVFCIWKTGRFWKKTPMWKSYYNKVAAGRPVTLLKRDSDTLTLTYEFCIVFQNSFL